MKLLQETPMPFEITAPSIEIADGTYPATLERVEDYTHPTFGDGRKWFWLIEHDGKIDSLSSITSNNTGPASKVYKYLSALLGRELKAGERIEDPTGSRCLLQITHNSKGFPKVEAVLPYVSPQQSLPGIPR